MILTIEPLLLSINALPKSLLIPTETRIMGSFGYIMTGQFLAFLLCKHFSLHKKTAFRIYQWQNKFRQFAV
ncbi:hypothetical protein CXF64_03280 [Pseudoalteromonas sp. GutCa3]|nr:hypothetical protein CXF75_03495 [Pseudoalteromonas arctica]PKG71862.1 hypothetical protein CXF64_03280 [Pseudoalteromonas sp. GutCa3]PKH92264.1 hypothetical protein CXF76_07305 [Pseudoalteromonas sp. 78C3]